MATVVLVNSTTVTARSSLGEFVKATVNPSLSASAMLLSMMVTLKLNDDCEKGNCRSVSSSTKSDPIIIGFTKTFFL